MTSLDLCRLGVRELSRGYREGSFSPVDVVEATLSRIYDVNASLNAYLTILGDSALKAAKAATLQFEAGVDLGPLQGVPFSVKDNIAVSGIRTTAASKVLADEPPDAMDSWVVRQLRQRGSILLGKTNLSEFAYGDPDEESPFGFVQNPRKLGHQAGASSNGSAAAVAAGLCVFSIGTDVGGSVRHPASVCGIVGLKPSIGRLPLEGVFPDRPLLDNLGVLARSVDDVASVYGTLEAGALDAHAGSHQEDSRHGLAASHRVAFIADMCLGIAHPEVIPILKSARKDLDEVSLLLPDVDIPASHVDRCGEIIGVLSSVDLSDFHERFASREHLYGRAFRERVAPGRQRSGVEYARAQAQQRALRSTMEAHFQGMDILATPANLHPAPRHGVKEVATPSGPRPVRDVNARFTKIASATGFPAMSVPIGEVDQLPIGLQLIASPGHEEALLAVGLALEARRGSLAAHWGIDVNSSAGVRSQANV